MKWAQRMNVAVLVISKAVIEDESSPVGTHLQNQLTSKHEREAGVA